MVRVVIWTGALLAALAVLAGCGGGAPNGTTSSTCYDYEPAPFTRPGELAQACRPQVETLCFEYQPAPITRPDDVREACVPPEWPFERAAITGADFEFCDSIDDEFIVFFWLMEDHANNPGHMDAGCVPRWSCRYNDLANPECCDGVELVNGYANCF